MSVARIVSTLWLLTFVATPTARAHQPMSIEQAELTERVNANPTSLELRFERARAYRIDERFEHALDDLLIAESLAPRDPRLHLERARVFFDQNNWSDAEASLDRYLSLVPANVHVLLLHALCRAALGAHEDALRDLQVAREFGFSVDVVLAHGELLEELGRDQEAEALYAQSRAAAVVRARLRVLTRLGRFEEAHALVETGLARARVKTIWWLRQSELFDAQGRAVESAESAERALDAAERAFARRPSANAQFLRARALVRLGIRDAAIADLEVVVRRAPRQRQARVLLAQLRGEEQ